MHCDETAFTPLEVKFASDSATGEFEGYGAIYGTQDSHGDLILPGAFSASLATRSAQGRALPMYAQHGPYLGGDHLPVGVWKSVEDDGRGLKVAGQIVGMDTDRGRVIHSLVKAGALAGLSIEYKVANNGAAYGKSAGEPKRTIKAANLFGISLVADPSHPEAGVASIKSRADGAFTEFARRLVAGNPMSPKEFEDVLREADIPKSMAAQICSVGYAKAIRSESEGAPPADVMAALKAAVSSFR